MAGKQAYTVRVHHEPGEELWAEVLELPGCFAAGADMDELRQALTEAMSLYLSEPGDVKHVELEDEPGSVTEHRMLARTAERSTPRPLTLVGCTIRSSSASTSDYARCAAGR